MDAWLLFFASDDPEDVIRLIEEYPEFRAIYEQAYQTCRNMGDVMGLFSEELRILDRNTVQYMIDEMQEKIDILIKDQRALMGKHESLINEKNQLIEQMQRRIAELESK